MKGIIKELLGWLVFIFIVVAASYLVVTYVGQRTEVSGSSMERGPAYRRQDIIPVPRAEPLRYRCISISV